MHGGPKPGKHRMVTVVTRVEPHEVLKLKVLADDRSLSLSVAHPPCVCSMLSLVDQRLTPLTGAAA